MKWFSIAGIIVAGIVLAFLAYNFMRIEPLTGVPPMNQTNAEVAVLETSMGTIEIELFRDKAPITVENFVGYVKDGSYDRTVFHRVMSDFMIQGGGFLANGTQKPTKQPIKLESRNGISNTRGTVAMARTMIPDSATNQFFISVTDNPFLDYSAKSDGYAVFGKVTSGMDVVDMIRAVPTETRGQFENWPKQDVTITKVYLR
jgi:peptidyl-prolyl cis-trans isomerase A (cyclophilin A)